MHKSRLLINNVQKKMHMNSYDIVQKIENLQKYNNHDPNIIIIKVYKIYNNLDIRQQKNKFIINSLLNCFTKKFLIQKKININNDIITTTGNRIERKCLHIWGQRLCLCQFLDWLDSHKYKCIQSNLFKSPLYPEDNKNNKNNAYSALIENENIYNNYSQ